MIDADILDEVAREAILDSRMVSDLIDCDQFETAERIVMLNRSDDAQAALDDFRAWLLFEAKLMFTVQFEAERRTTDRSIYRRKS